ncbi:MAG: autotransporter-associated beta strand repeat-containing protein [Pirellulales bacterium]
MSTASVGLLTGAVSVAATSPQAATPTFSQAVTMGVLDHATASFASATTLVSLDIDFGTLTQGTGPADRTFSIFNRAGSLGAAWTAKLDLDHVLASVPGGIFSTTLSAFTNLSSGSSRTYGLSMLTTTSGSFSGTYSLSLSDEDLPGATSQPLSLTVRGSVVSPGNVVLDVPTGSKTQAELGFAAITGSAAVTKIGGGTAILSGTNSFTGPLSIADGILQSGGMAGLGNSSLIEITANATLDLSAIPGGYTVANGQTLGGSGTVVGSVVFGRGSTLSPGMFAAATTVTAAVSPAVAGSLVIDQAASVAVPEPMGWSLVLAGLGCGAACRARRSRRSDDRS